MDQKLFVNYDMLHSVVILYFNLQDDLRIDDLLTLLVLFSA